MIDSIFAKGGKLAQAASASLLSGSDRRKKRAKEGLAISAILELFKVGKEEQEQLKATDISDLQSELNLDSKRSEYIYNDEIAPVLTAEKNYRDNGGGGKLLLDENNKPVLTEDGRLQFAKLENGELARGAGNNWFLNNPANPRNANVVFQSSDDYIEMAGAKGYQYLTKADKEAIKQRKQEIADMLEQNHLNKINNPLFKDQNITNPIDFFQKGVYNKYKASVDEINQDPTRARVGGYLLSKISKFGDDTNLRLREATGKAQKIQKDIDSYVEELRQPSQGMPTSSVLSARYRGNVNASKEHLAFAQDIADNILEQEENFNKDFEVDMLTYNPDNPFDLTGPLTPTNPFSIQNTNTFGFGGNSIQDMWGRDGKIEVRQTAMQNGQIVVRPFNEKAHNFVVPAEKFANMIASTARQLKEMDIRKIDASGSKFEQQNAMDIVTNKNYKLEAVQVLAGLGNIQKTADSFIIIENANEPDPRGNIFQQQIIDENNYRLENALKLDEAFASYRSTQIDSFVKSGESGDRISALESTNPQVNALELFKFVLNPPEDLKGTPVSSNKQLLSLGNIPESTALQMYESYKGQFGDSFVLENIIKELYPTETETEVKVEPVVIEPDPPRDYRQKIRDEKQEIAGNILSDIGERLGKPLRDSYIAGDKDVLIKYAEGKELNNSSNRLKDALERAGLSSDATPEIVAKYLTTGPSLLEPK